MTEQNVSSTKNFGSSFIMTGQNVSSTKLWKDLHIDMYRMTVTGRAVEGAS